VETEGWEAVAFYLQRQKRKEQGGKGEEQIPFLALSSRG
jgi:hypothetical protein